MNFENALSPMYIGNMFVKNRLVVPAMDSAMCEEDGSIGKMACDYYGSRAKGGYGLVITEIAAVDDKAMGMPGQPKLYDDKYIAGLTRLADAIHTGGAKAIVQLHHAGRETTSQMIGQTPSGPSSIPSLVYREPVNEYTTEEVYDLVDSYINAAIRCEIAGFDGIEFHSAHGYMGLQFWSQRTNKRIDEFGGGLDGRSYFHKLIIQGIREACGEDFAIILRIDTIEGIDGGVDENEAVVFARLMEDYGADAINVSAGTYAAWDVIVPPPDFSQGWNWQGTRRIKEAVNIPVMSAGRFSDPIIIEQSIERGDADFICLGRASIADPEFPNKLAGGDIDSIVPCVGCTQRCMSFNDHDTLLEGDWGVSCMYNPASNNREDVQYTSTDNPKDVMVVGGGPAGLETAWIAAERGHNVTLYEKNSENRLGGELLLAAYPPFKQDITRPIRHYKHMCKKYGVNMVYNTEVTDELIKEKSPDVLVVAVGAKPFKLDIPGKDNANVYMANDVLLGKSILANSVLVIGGGLVGVETAEFAREYCDRVEVVEMKDQAATDIYMTVRDRLLKRFKEKEIKIHTNTKVTKIEDDCIVAIKGEEEIRFKDFDNVIFAVGSKAIKQFDNVEELADEVYIIGDAKESRSAVEAIYEGFRVGTTI